MNRSARFALVTLLAVAGAAFGQNALGDGTALDASTQVGSQGKNNRVRDLVEEIKFRNAIVTGNAPNGLSFRGDLPYSAPSDFRDSLGSNDTFLFRRDSLDSGLGGLGLRGTDGLQRQFAMTTGTRIPDHLRGSLIVPRAGGGDLPVRPTKPVEDDPGSLWSLRSTSAYSAGRSVEPALLETRVYRPTGDILGYAASGLRGLETIQVGKTPEGWKPNQPRFAAPLQRDANSLGAANPDLLARYNAYTPETPVTVTDPWEQQLAELRAMLDAWDEEEAAKAPQPAVTTPTATPFDPALVERLRKAPGTLTELRSAPAADQQSKSFDAAMAQGTDQLKDREYFAAELSFSRALGFRGSDAMAAIGRAHAQIGAGLYQSAAMNLRALFRERPDMIGVRYNADLLPSSDRLRAAANGAMVRMAAGGALRREWALLLAYCGFHTGDGALLQSGLDGMAPDEGAPIDPLDDLIRRVWQP